MPGRVARIAGAGAAVVLPLAPKCPLCLLPLAAAVGIALPSGPLVDLGVALMASLWVAAMVASRRSPVRKAAAAGAALLLLGGRAAGADWAVWAGAAGMLASGLARGARCGRPQSPASSPFSRSRVRAIWSALR